MDGETPIATSKYTVTYSGDNINAGTATVNIEDIAGDDLIVYGSKTFTINKKDLTITAKPKTERKPATTNCPMRIPMPLLLLLLH